ncbi:MAG TPA: tetratricopeptide repeat protein [Terriglobales bacterium]
MKTQARLVTLLLVAAALLSTAGCNKLMARDQLNKGVQAYRSANYEQAIEHFKNAVALDDDLKVAKLYLATAYTSQYVPDVDTPENLRMAQQAIEEYQRVLDRDPDSVNSLKGIGYLYLHMKKFDQSREYYQKAIAKDPNDPELYYSLGVIDWTEAFKDAREIKAQYQMREEEELNAKKDAKLCELFKTKDGAIVDDGMTALKTAIDKRQDYDDAMVYLNLLYLRKANDLTCDDPQQRADDKAAANGWSDKAMAARKKKAEDAAKKNQGGIVLEATPTPSPQK